MIRTTFYFASGNEQSSHDCETAQEAFDRCVRSSMTDTQRAILRMKQDFLLMLVVDMANMPEHLAVTEGGPRISQLRGCIWPAWEGAIDSQVAAYAKELHVSIPSFAQLAQAA